jgi:hypothetical protein
MLLAVAVVAVPGCGVGTMPDPDTPQASDCAWERAAVEATSAAVAALDAAAESVEGDQAEAVRAAVIAARAVVTTGRSAVDLCDDAVTRPRWWTWAGDALAALGGIVDILQASGVPYTREVSIAVAVVQATLAAMSPPSEVCPVDGGKGGRWCADPPSMAELRHATEVLLRAGQ